MTKSLPTGTVTFLFTDIEGSTKLWESVPEKMKVALQRHHEILNCAIESNGGVVFQIIGDAFCAAFPTAPSAMSAALKAQENLFNENWDLPSPIRVRMGIHTGLADLTSSDSATGGYTSNQTLNRVARIMSAGHGGQILLSLATEELTRDSLPANTELRDMGERHLRDLIRPEHLFQLNAKGLPSEFPPLKTLDFYRHNLSIQLTSFIGREKEIAEIEHALTEHRLVTLTGSGGTGKTRLSLQVAANLLDHFPDGVWFVELAPLTNPDLIPQTIHSTIGIQEQPGKTPLQLLEEYLHERKTLVVLDNCEHLIEASAKVANTLLNAAPSLKVLASSREALGVKGELSYPVPSLSLPDPKHLPAIEQLSQYEAVRLFIDRALLVAPHFVVDKDNAPFIAQICYRLDGIPLAIELAAARIRSMPVDKIAGRLDDRFHLLTGGSRTALPRQQTLRATIDWSYDLLSKSERMLFCRLAVFMGGWRLESVEEICTGDEIASDNIDDLLGHLVDKSLVELEENGRYRMLETIRQYARDRLVESGEGEALRDRHRDWFLALAEQAMPELHRETQLEWLDRLDEELENLRTALEWSLRNNIDAAQQLAGALWWFWHIRGRAFEGYQWINKILAIGDDVTLARAALLGKAGQQAFMLNYQKEARAFSEKSIAMFQLLGQKNGQADPLLILGILAFYDKDFSKAKEMIEQSCDLCRDADDRWGLKKARDILGWIAEDEGNYEQARKIFEEGYKISSELGDKDGASYSLVELGGVFLAQNEYEYALKYFEQSLAIAREVKGIIVIIEALKSIGLVALRINNFEKAELSFEECRRLYEDAGIKAGEIQSIRLLGLSARVKGDYQKAAAMYQKSLTIIQESRDAESVGRSILGIALTMVKQGNLNSAVQLIGASNKAIPKITENLLDLDKEDLDQTIARAKSGLGDTTFENLWAEGESMSIEEAIAFALRESND